AALPSLAPRRGDLHPRLLERGKARARRGTRRVSPRDRGLRRRSREISGDVPRGLPGRDEGARLEERQLPRRALPVRRRARNPRAAAETPSAPLVRRVQRGEHRMGGGRRSEERRVGKEGRSGSTLAHKRRRTNNLKAPTKRR